MHLQFEHFSGCLAAEIGRLEVGDDDDSDDDEDAEGALDNRRAVGDSGGKKLLNRYCFVIEGI